MQNKLSRNLAVSLIAISALSLANPALAQRGGGAGGSQGGGMMSMPAMQGRGDLDRTRDQDRLRDPAADQDKDQTRDRDQDKDQDGDRDQDKDQDRDRDRLRDDQAVAGQLSAWSLLTDGEREQFRKQIRTATTEQDRDRIRAEHQAVVQERARDLGIGTSSGPQSAGSAAGNRDGYYLAQMLTEQERLQFHQRMRKAANEQERERIRTEMQTMARERAQEMGVNVPAWFGQSAGQQ